MKFSVLLSLYNKEKPSFLSECLDSIANNTLLPEQIVIVYDGPIGSDLEAVVNDFSKRLPIDIVPLSNNVGLGSALNHGLKFCNYETILRMDTDDVCTQERFSKQINYLKLHPNIGLLGGAIREFDENMSIPGGIRFSNSDHGEIKDYAKKRNPFNHMAVAFNKTAVERVGGYQHHHLMEDYNLWLRMIASGVETHNLKEVLVNVRAGNSMLIRRKGLKYIRSEVKLAKLKYDLKIDGFFGTLSCAFIRIIPRLMPVFLLNSIYKILRK
ncbi:glycosyltransferase [Enterobacter sp. KBR-315C3_2022]|uniref:glycosyltransferase n=1 Tax=Enterobacter sp. KBR-315C3_2022 TaxID=3242494 RepID=UPI003527F7C6